MTRDEAAWVREHAWTQAHRDLEAAYPGGWYGRCACQHGICGACEPDHPGGTRHDRCLTRQHGGPVRFWLASVTNAAGNVTGAHLWPASGPSCRYLCPCPCRKTGTAFPPARRNSLAARAGQLDLFSVEAS